MDLFRQKEGVVFDPYLVFSVVIDGTQYDFTTTTREIIEFRKKVEAESIEPDDRPIFLA